MIVGQETPDGGKLRVGDTVVVSYVDQNRDTLNPENTIFQEISGGLDKVVLGKRKVPSRAYVAQFNFKGPDQEKKVGNLSGGERNRVHLAKLLKSGGNLLLLDEPTNDLDVDMLRALEEALARLRRLRRGHQPRPLVPRPDRHPHPRLRGGQPGRLVRRQLPDLRGPAQASASALDADQPHRIRYKALTRRLTNRPGRLRHGREISPGAQAALAEGGLKRLVALLAPTPNCLGAFRLQPPDDPPVPRPDDAARSDRWRDASACWPTSAPS